MSLAAFSAIVFAVAGIVCFVSFGICLYKISKVIDVKARDGENMEAVTEMFSNEKWYVRFIEQLVTPTFYIAVAGLLVAVVAAVIGA